MVLAKRRTICKVRPTVLVLFCLNYMIFSIAHTFEDLVAKYGPVVTLRQGSQITVVIGRVDV